VVGAGGGAISRVGGLRRPRSWRSERRVVRCVAVQRSWLARRLAAFVRGSGPPSVRFRRWPPGRPWGEPAMSDGHGGAGRRAA
jgi:hypothetical protein